MVETENKDSIKKSFEFQINTLSVHISFYFIIIRNIEVEMSIRQMALYCQH